SIDFDRKLLKYKIITGILKKVHDILCSLTRLQVSETFFIAHWVIHQTSIQDRGIWNGITVASSGLPTNGVIFNGIGLCLFQFVYFYHQ
ncbi:AGAP009817-PA, partial [Anopheles gambiae str. PEST]